MSEKINYKWVPNPKQGDLKMNTDTLLFIENPNKKKPVGDQIDILCKKYVAARPEVDYETALKKVLSYPGNEKLAKTYGISPLTMI